MYKNNDMRSLIIAITGASGAAYAQRLFDHIHANTSLSIKIILSRQGIAVLNDELGIDPSYFDKERVTRYDNKNLHVSIASGSAQVDGMVIVPASMGTLARIANGISHDLIGRTADVMLKERKPLIVVPRETPVNTIHLENMLTLSKMSGIIVPASPGFYHNPKTITDIIDFIVAKVLSQLGIKHDLLKTWNPHDECTEQLQKQGTASR